MSLFATGLVVRAGESEEVEGLLQAPEQFRGSAQPKSDAYGAGATLLYLLTGTLFLSCPLPLSPFPSSVSTLHFGRVTW